MTTKFIFVTGGVVSGLGKGITAASLGRLLKARGLKVAAQKLDPYINVDPGTMSPYPVSYTHLDVYKRHVCAAIDAWAAKVEALAQDIEREPELGFKETKTAAKVTRCV